MRWIFFSGFVCSVFVIIEGQTVVPMWLVGAFAGINLMATISEPRK